MPSIRRVARRTARRTSRRQNAMMQPESPESSVSSQLEELARLKNQGVISEEEFNAKKKQILGI